MKIKPITFTIAFAIILSILSYEPSPAASSDQTFLVYGPADFVRSTRSPATVSRTFTIVNQNTEYTLRLYNGGLSGQFIKVSSAIVTLNGAQIFGVRDLNQNVGVIERPVVLLPQNELTVELRSVPNSGLTLEVLGIDRDPPTITASLSPSPNSAGWNNTDVTVSFLCFDATSGIASCPADVTVTTEGANQVVSGTATDNAGNTATTSVTVHIDKTGPQIFITSPADGTTVTVPDIDVAGTVSDALSGLAGVSCNGLPAVFSGQDFACNVALVQGPNLIAVEAADIAGNTTESAITINLASGGTIPPDPSTVAPPLDLSTATTLAAATEFLYTGSNPIQTGVAPGTIQPIRAAVLRGKVMTRDGDSLPGVSISILNHPEFGGTLSREDGMFDMAVNGGGILVVNYEKQGFLPAQRSIEVPWRDYKWIDDVALVSLDSQVTVIDFSEPMEVARGSVVTDEDGTRQATLLFPQGTAVMVMPNGAEQPLMSLRVRATEYTVGPNGPAAMPAELPPTSAYTYAVEFSADEAMAAAAKEVRFSVPVICYVENFLGFPVGGNVPVGLYDREKAAWIPSDDGRIVKILGITSGLANLDITGDDIADNALSELGVTDLERQHLASLYQRGQSLWRVLIPHFTPSDLNWPYDEPAELLVDGAHGEALLGDCCTTGGSIIRNQNQTLGEALPLEGTPFNLHYQSERSAGRKASNVLEIPITGDTVPNSLTQILLQIEVAGRRFSVTLHNTPNQTYTFVWDGKDAYGRQLQGKQPVNIRIGYTYIALGYQFPASLGGSFGLVSGFGIPEGAVPTRQNVIVWKEERAEIGPWDVKKLDLGGWMLSVHHSYDVNGRTLYLGNGELRTVALGEVIGTAAGNGNDEFSGDGDLAGLAGLNEPVGVAVGPDGSVYIADSGNGRVRRVGPDGIISTVAGGGSNVADEIPATDADLSSPAGLAVGADGSLFIAESSGHRVRRVSPDGMIHAVAGNGIAGSGGDGGPAKQAQLYSPYGLAVAADGTLYIVEQQGCRVRRVGPDGRITTVAGNGTYGYSGDDGPASLSQLDSPVGIALGADGSLYVADSGNQRIRRIGANGIITTVAGNGTAGYNGDGGPATEAELRNPVGVSLGTDGNLYIVDIYRIRKVGIDGIITTVAGMITGGSGYSGDGGPATKAQLNYPHDAKVGPSGNLYVADRYNHRVRRITPPLPDFSGNEVLIAAEDGSEVYVFDSTGRHLRTRDALLGFTRYEFGYNSEGRLTSITDVDGNVTTIQRDATGKPTAVVGPYGQRTTLYLDANGNLSSAEDPAGNRTEFTYSDDGLMETLTDPRNGTYRFEYDSLGRLTKDEDPAGGFRRLNRTDDEADSYTVSITSALNRVRSNLVEELSTGSEHRINTDAAGLSTDVLIGTDGSRKITGPDGTVTTTLEGPDPRFGIQAPVLQSLRINTPGGLISTITESRTAVLSDAGDPFSFSTLTETVKINNRTFTSIFDAATRTITNSSPVGRQSFTTLDANGRITQSLVTGLAAALLDYDLRGRLETIRQNPGADERRYTLQYNAQGYVSQIEDPLSRTAGFEYDSAGRLTKQTLPDTREIVYSYDENGNLTSITPPGRPVHSFDYTAVDLPENYSPPDVGAGTNNTTYFYNFDRQITQVLRPDGAAIDFDYDTGGRLTTLLTPRGNTTFSYDAGSGNLGSVSVPGGSTLSYGYDGSLLKISAWTGTVAGNVSRTYNNNFQITSERVNNANTVSFLYDLDGLLTKAGNITIARSAQNGLITGTTLGSVTDNRSYNLFGETENYAASFGASSLFSANYTRDQLGRIRQKTETTAAQTNTYIYDYDTAGRLTDVTKNSAAVAHYEYDANSNRILHSSTGGSVTGVYDAQDRLTQYGDFQYAYSANGDLQSKTNIVTGEITTYNYDLFGNLVSATLPSGTQIEYIIDGTNRRIGKKVNGVLVRGFLYRNSLQLAAELGPTNNVVSRFIYGSKANVPDYMIKSGVTYRIISDHLGSPRLVVHTTTGAVVQRMDYDEFGNVTSDTNPGFQPLGFAGGLYDSQTGLVRFGVRDYDPQTGRWTSKDPILFAGGDTNLYGYVLNDPVNFIDPWGNIAIAVAGGAAAGGALAVVGAVALTIAAPIVAYDLNERYLEGPIMEHVIDDWLGLRPDASPLPPEVLLTKHIKEVIAGLIAQAEIHVNKCTSYPPDDPNQDKWRKEIEAFLERAERLAEKRLPPRQAEKILEQMNQLRQLIQ